VTAENHPLRPVVQSTLPFNAGGDPITDVKPGQEVAKIAFGLEKPGDVPNDIIPLQSGYAVIALKEKTPVSQEQWDKERETFLQTLRAHKEHDTLIGYVKRLRTKYTNDIKIGPEFLTEPKVKPGEGGEEGPPMEDPLGGE
jgi:peptidyl-prolyl cis-trans isomerase D